MATERRRRGKKAGSKDKRGLAKPKLAEGRPGLRLAARTGLRPGVLPGTRRDGSETRNEGFRELTWGGFDELARDLAKLATDYDPQLVIGIVKGGLFVGSAVAGLLRVEFIPVRLSKRSRDRLRLSPGVRTEVPAEVRNKRVLVVDDVVQSGDTLRQAVAAIEAAGAADVRSAALVVHTLRPKLDAKPRLVGKVAQARLERPDWYALETDDLVVFPWDYELRSVGPMDLDPGESGA